MNRIKVYIKLIPQFVIDVPTIRGAVYYATPFYAAKRSTRTA